MTLNFLKYVPSLRMTAAAFGLGACILAQSPLMADEPEEVGLTGLVPLEVPEGLSNGSLSALPEGWSDWRTETNAALEKLFGFDVLSLEEQDEVLTTLDNQLAEIYSSVNQISDRDTLEALIDLEGKLSRRLDLYHAILETLASNQESREELRPALQQFIEAIENYESDNGDGKSDEAVYEALANVRSTAKGGVPALEKAVKVNYFNFNVRTFVSEPFADHAFNECRRECGPVCDYILGARVTGHQRTKSGVYMDFLPSDTDAKIAIRINGNTKSSTQGVTDQATVYTSGNHFFTGKKVLSYDGSEFSYYQACLGVNANNRVTCAKLNHQGILAKVIGNRIAYEKAVEMTPQSERIAASRLRGRVLPKFNREIQDTFNDLNDENAARRARMAEEGIAPNEVLARTDENELRTAERLMNPGQLGADRATTVFNTSTGMTMHVHESWVNNSLAVETLNIEEEQISFPEFGELLTAKFRRAFDIDREQELGEDDGTDVILSSEFDPLHVQFDGGLIKIILRIGLKTENREEPIGVRRVEIPVQLIMEEDTIRFEVAEDSDIRVLPLGDDRNIAANGVMRNTLRDRFSERLAEETFDRHILFDADDEGKQIPVTIAEIHPTNGWLIIVVEPDER